MRVGANDCFRPSVRLQRLSVIPTQFFFAVSLNLNDEFPGVSVRESHPTALRRFFSVACESPFVADLVPSAHSNYY